MPIDPKLALGRELGEGKSGTALDEPEKRRLASSHAELLRLLAQLARKPEENRPQIVGDELGTKRNVTNH